MPVTDRLTLLVAAADPLLRGECESALAALEEPRPILRCVDDPRQGAEAARSWRPTLAVVELAADLRPLKLAVDEIRAASPETVMVAAFRPSAFPPDVAESAVLIEALRLGVGDFLRRPVSAADLAQLWRRFASSARQAPSRTGRVVTFISNKGGVGKSTLATNVACEVAARRPGRVLLIDGSLQMGVCAAMLDLEPPATLTDAVRQRDRLDEALLSQIATPHESGLHLLAAPRSALEATEVTDAAMAQVVALARRTYDLVIVDTFPMFDGVVVAVLDLADRAYLVLENVVPTLLGGMKFVELLDGLGFPHERQRLVLNRFARGGGNLRPRDVVERLGRDIDHIVPHDRGVVTAANLGEPFVRRAGRFSSCAREMRRIARDVDALLNERAHENNGAANHRDS